ncbi:hypothetical protein H4219_002986 [Mycoemilia scoparia]|uniref:Uncharacterized protein n=1 Tax=Mycoemilia scoparia TaxID=417184 RepID=A0A9W8A1B6_9FUNG|nr:hypothetical protein H4219_002986 [Mycoemilia scoparia]
MCGASSTPCNCPPTPSSAKFFHDEGTGVVLSPVFQHNGSPWTVARIPLKHSEVTIDFTTEQYASISLNKPAAPPTPPPVVESNPKPCDCGCEEAKKKKEEEKAIFDEKLDTYKWHLLAHESDPTCPWCPFCCK